jgi:multicomponent Na+:H+ antiporter subunit D
MVGAASISAFPLFSGFVTKSMVITAAMEGGYFWTWMILLFASAGVFHHAGIKIPYFAFFAHDSGKRCEEAPGHMLAAMAIAAACCIGIGSLPWLFYQILPFKADYVPYTADHVVGQVQLLFLSALAFTLLMRTGIYPPELRSTNLDFDWFYRRLGYSIAMSVGRGVDATWSAFVNALSIGMRKLVGDLQRYHGHDGVLARTWSTGSMAFWTTVMLGAYLVLSYL